MMEWISVKDRLPTVGVNVLLCVCGDACFVASFQQCAEWSCDWNDWTTMFGTVLLHSSQATHWMPLPAPPGKEADGLDKGQ